MDRHYFFLNNVDEGNSFFEFPSGIFTFFNRKSKNKSPKGDDFVGFTFSIKKSKNLECNSKKELPLNL